MYAPVAAVKSQADAGSNGIGLATDVIGVGNWIGERQIVHSRNHKNFSTLNCEESDASEVWTILAGCVESFVVNRKNDNERSPMSFKKVKVLVEGRWKGKCG